MFDLSGEHTRAARPSAKPTVPSGCVCCRLPYG